MLTGQVQVAWFHWPDRIFLRSAILSASRFDTHRLSKQLTIYFQRQVAVVHFYTAGRSQRKTILRAPVFSLALLA